MISKTDFEALSPYERGYCVYMVGCRDDEPHVPDEDCPYSDDDPQVVAWHAGLQQAVLDAQD